MLKFFILWKNFMLKLKYLDIEQLNKNMLDDILQV